MSRRVEPEKMVVHFLLEHRNKREFQIRPYYRDEVEEYRADFEARGAKVEFDGTTGLMTVSHSERLRSLVSDAEVWEDRKAILGGCGMWLGFKLAILASVLIAVAIGAGAVTAWFGLLATLCIGGAIFEQKDRKVRIIMAIVFAGIASLDLPWGKWFP